MIRRVDGSALDVELLWRRKSLLLFSTAAALCLGVVYLCVTEPTYEVESRVLIENRGLSATGSPENSARYREFLATQGEILRSRKIIVPVIETTDLWQSLSGRTEDREALIAKTLEDFEVATVVNTDVLKLRYRNTQAKYAVQLLDGVLDEYVAYVRESDKQHYGRMLETLGKSETELRNLLAAKGEELAKCRSQNGLVGTGRDMVHLQLSSLNRLTERLAETRRGRVELAIQLGSIKNGDETAEHAILSPSNTTFVAREPFSKPAGGAGTSSFPQLRDARSNEPTEARGAYDVVRELWQARSTFEETNTRFGPKHPEYQAAKQRAEEWTAYTEQHNAALIRMLENELLAIEDAEEELQQMVDDEYSRLKEFDIELLRELQLTKEIDRIESAHAISLERLRDYKMTDDNIEQGKTSTNIVVLNRPTAPQAPVWPQPIPFLGICGVFGLTLSSIAALYL